MTAPINSPVSRLVSLINYVEVTEGDRLKIELDYRNHKGFAASFEELDGLPGVALDCGDDSDPIWLRVERLAKVAPPSPEDPELALWASIRDDVESRPTLKQSVSGASLVQLGLLSEEDAPDIVSLDDYERKAALSNALDAWTALAWEPWSTAEGPRRQAIAIYNALYMLRQQLEGVSEVPVELVCGIGFATLARQGKRLRYPLLSMSMELSLNEASHCIEARPRSEADPYLEIATLDRMGLNSLDQWLTSSAAYLNQLEETVLSPFYDESFEAILRQASALLDADGVYLPDAKPDQARIIPKIEQDFQVSKGAAFFQRERRATPLIDDLRRFRTLLTGSDEPIDLPLAVNSIVSDPSGELQDEEYPQFRGISTIPGVTSSDGDGKDLFFPKPFNREQVEVVQRLETRPGVVVQGPPGTGKTHTIANIISHYLALGKRVLVTSQKAPALRVLRDKLPEAVRPLAVSLIDSDREGLKQFQESVDIIAEKLQRLRRHELEREIADLDHQIDNLHRHLARIDNEVDAIGRLAVTSAHIDGEMIEPVRAARMVVAEPELTQWIDDELDLVEEHAPQFSEDDVTSLRKARKKIAGDIRYLGLTLPKSADLPRLEQLLAVHRNLSRVEELRRQVASGTLPDLKVKEDEIDAKLERLSSELEALIEISARVQRAAFDWTPIAIDTIRLGNDRDITNGIEALLPEIDFLVTENRHFLPRPVQLPDDALEDEKLLEAISRSCDGRPAVGLLTGLFAAKLKSKINEIRILGERPSSSEQWQEISRYIESVRRGRKLSHAWNAFISIGVGTPVDIAGFAESKRIQEQLVHIDEIRALISQQRRVDGLARELISNWISQVQSGEDVCASLRTIIETHQLRRRLEAAEETRTKLLATLAKGEGEITRQLEACAVASLGNPDVSHEEFHARWEPLNRRLLEIESLAEAFETLQTVASTISSSGAPIWAEKLRTQAIAGSEDELSPGDWSKRWRLRRLSAWLSRIDRHSRLIEIGKERAEKEELLREAYERSIELRTWLQLSNKATDTVKSALAAYADAVRRIGKGTGKRAGRYRRQARDASNRAKGALPCWIMPHYRVSESLPSEFGLFDLVIVDEASQSTVSALPALLRAKKILIVGDDRQVSPELVGRDQSRADELANRHLMEQVPDYRASLREEQSLYDLGKVVFAGGAIMLTEHFRCVAPIIEFSKAQFYGHRLTPLRLPLASERLDPPLIDVFVEEGFRKGDTNPAEAKYIVTEIEALTKNDAFARRTIGVTTLLGQDQAKHIYNEIEQTLGTEVMERHSIRVGDPTAFQGDERDIMFVSLVAQRDDKPLSGSGYDKRFNVALSRARDRTYLVRSVELDQLRTSDQLRRKLLEHFRCPYPSETTDLADRRGRCESDFERVFFDLLSERGYRIDTQVRVGNFRIDIVVEGENDRRVAIECDGDRYHGPDKWPDDMMRQRVLERSGWTVWRCFASRFVRNRDAVVEELVGFLSAMGIEPVSDGDGWVSRHTELRTWRAPENEELEGEVTSNIPTVETATEADRDPPEQDIDEPGSEETAENEPRNEDRVTERQVQEAILQLMSDGRIWSNAELKEALPAILPLSGADRQPSNSRPGEEKWEELVNNAFSPARGNSLQSRGLVSSAGRGLHVLSGDEEHSVEDEAVPQEPFQEANSPAYSSPDNSEGAEYRIAELDIAPTDDDRIYEEAYKSDLECLVDLVLEVEAPIYKDILIERIARAHRKERVGRIIQETVSASISADHPITPEEGREVVFFKGFDPYRLVAFRPSSSDQRAHRDIPLIELAGLVWPLVAEGMSDPDILNHLARRFGLARVREQTRLRFESAIKIARAAGS